jgi:23S rRNA (adenine2030-N6)-methyltransferase
LLRDKDRLVAVEAQDAEFAPLRAALRPYARARAIHGDGYRELKRLLPPPERRGLILIDPPYEAADEFEQATRAIVAAHRRFATGIVLFWYPAKERPMVAAAAGELMTAGIRSLLRVELDVGIPQRPVAPDRGPPLTATGLLAINPPYGFAEEMRSAVAFLAERLAQGPGANGTMDILAAH